MILNSRDNFAYDYGNLATQPIPSRRPTQLRTPSREQAKPQEKPSKAVRVKPKLSKRQKVAMVLMTLTVIATFALIIFRFAAISVSNNGVTQLKSELAQQIDVQDRLKVKLITAQNLERIKQRAKDDLEMDFPKEDQLYYFEMGAENEVPQKQ